MREVRFCFRAALPFCRGPSQVLPGSGGRSRSGRASSRCGASTHYFGAVDALAGEDSGLELSASHEAWCTTTECSPAGGSLAGYERGQRLACPTLYGFEENDPEGVVEYEV